MSDTGKKDARRHGPDRGRICARRARRRAAARRRATDRPRRRLRARGRLLGRAARRTCQQPSPRSRRRQRLWSGIEAALGRAAGPTRACRAMASLELLARPCPWRERARRCVHRRAHLCRRGRNAGRRRSSPGSTPKAGRRALSPPSIPAAAASPSCRRRCSPAEQKSMELWLIPPGDKPHSLGLIDPEPAGDDQGAEGTSVACQQRSRACGFARAARRLADRPAHRPRDRQRQARQLEPLPCHRPRWRTSMPSAPRTGRVLDAGLRGMTAMAALTKTSSRALHPPAPAASVAPPVPPKGTTGKPGG